MRHVRMLGVCLFALCALGVLAAASQAETLEWGKCTAVAGGTGGKYTDAGCTERATHKSGGYEWTRLEEVEEEFIEDLRHITAVGGVSFETAAGAGIQCTGGANTASTQYAFNKRALNTPLWEFEGCEEAEGGQRCTANNNFPGEINDKYAWFGEPPEEGLPVPGWKGKLGFVSGAGTANPVVGIEYKVLNHERLFEPVKCEGVGGLGTVWIGGSRHGGDSFISTIEPVNTMTSQFTQVYGESAPGISSVTNFEGKKPVYLEAFLEGVSERVAMVATFDDEVERGVEELEIKATR